MTFNTDDLDRLADYAAGLLEPTEEAAVATLVATDPSWASAYEQLVDADAAIGAQLRAAGSFATDAPAAADDVMPADVVARIETAFAVARDEVPGVVSLVDRRAGSGSAGRTRRGSADIRERGKRRAGLVAVGALAAAVAAVVGGSMVNGSMSAQDSGSPVAGAPEQADAPKGADAGSVPDTVTREPASALSDLSSVPVTSSDANYTWVTLPLVAASPAARTGSAKSTFPEQVPAPFKALVAPAALQACLEAVDAVTAGTPSRAEFASYDGTPALVVVVTAPDEQLVVAVGPACGPGNPDVRAVRTAS